MSTFKSSSRLWVTWENQRRSVELAALLGCQLAVIETKGRLRYLLATLETVRLLVRTRPEILFAQNPSIVLAVVACLYGSITGTTIVIDRHSNFPSFSKLELWQRGGLASFSKRLFTFLSDFTLRRAQVTIVTNRYVAQLVESSGGRAHVLPDPIPVIVANEVPALAGRKNVMIVSSFADDEPVGEVLSAAEQLQSEGVVVYFSGNPQRASKDWRQVAPSNVRFTGFLPKAQYNDLLAAVDAVVVLSTVEHCLLCGCYEAVALEKPLVTSSTQALKSYFFGAAYSDPTAESIYEGISSVLADPFGYSLKSREMKERLGADWAKSFALLEEALSGYLQKRVLNQSKANAAVD